jgi:hypothetical protein
MAAFSKSFSEILEIFEGGIQVRQKAPSKRKDTLSTSFGAAGDDPIPRDLFRIIKAGVLRRRGTLTCIAPVLCTSLLMAS